MSLKSFWLNLLFPVECIACRREGIWLCSVCFKKLKFNTRNGKHNLNIKNVDQVFIAGDYNNPLLAKAIKRFKYNFIPEFGPILARFLIMFWQYLSLLNKQNSEQIEINQLPNNLNSATFLLIPIPLSPQRERWRGFNQSKILAQEFGSTLNYPINYQLKRQKHTKPQVTLNRKKRLQNIQGVFNWRGDNLSNQNIILIDDVITTGATLNEAALILRQAGANKIYALVLAKA